MKAGPTNVVLRALATCGEVGVDFTRQIDRGEIRTVGEVRGAVAASWSPDVEHKKRASVLDALGALDGAAVIFRGRGRA